MKNRKIVETILKCQDSKTGRILVLTGARQTGKTTLVRRLFPDYTYLSIEDPVMRSEYKQLSARQWRSVYPNAILDEVQKEPQLIESIKSVYDQWSEPRYILLGSSQLLLLEKVKESLAGRSVIVEVFPLTLPELRTESWEDPVEDSFFQREVGNKQTNESLHSFLLDKDMVSKQIAWENYLNFGGYPAVSDATITPDERYEWLRNYVRTYLERDIRDLASFRDLEPFIKMQRYLALNTAGLINSSDIANRLGITAKTVQRYLHYFEISYQAIILSAWANNPIKRLSKMPKFHYLDNGIVQAVLQKRGGLTGNEFESLVIAEIYKQIQTLGMQVQFYHLRTQDGKEVDLLVEFPDYFYAFEIKYTDNVNKSDAKHLFKLDEILDKPVRKAFVLSNDRTTKYFDDGIIAMHVAMFLG